MVTNFMRHTARLGRQAATGHLGWLRGAMGSVIGISLAGLVTMALLGSQAHSLPWLVAPLGASAVLVFAVPASPLAQPWPVIGGDWLSAAVGIAAGHLFHVPWLSAAIAVGAAIAVMSLCRCLHPPGGACALLCALGATGAQAWSWPVLLPIAANILILVAVGYAYNGLTGHPWPHRATTVPVPVANRPGYEIADLEAVLGEWNEVLDVDVADLDALFRAVERRADRRERGLVD
ncbi:HPP family protein [Novosphingobium colocasiae]|uniref:HPP family protein n=1 Tax=Novosphingobium colocasiae TaxID=1256513 RepID=UPI0035B363B9